MDWLLLESSRRTYAGFNLSIVTVDIGHISDKNNVVADTLSRAEEINTILDFAAFDKSPENDAELCVDQRPLAVGQTELTFSKCSATTPVDFQCGFYVTA